MTVLDDRSALTTPADQLSEVADRLHEILITGGTFDAIYRHVLTNAGKRRPGRPGAGLCRLLPSATVYRPTPSTWPARSRCSTRRRWCMTTSATVHSCDAMHRRCGRVRRPTAARAGFHLAGTALHVAARVRADNPTVFARPERGSGCHLPRPVFGSVLRSAGRDHAAHLRRRGAAPALRTRGGCQDRHALPAGLLVRRHGGRCRP